MNRRHSPLDTAAQMAVGYFIGRYLARHLWVPRKYRMLHALGMVGAVGGLIGLWVTANNTTGLCGAYVPPALKGIEHVDTPAQCTMLHMSEDGFGLVMIAGVIIVLACLRWRSHLRGVIPNWLRQLVWTRDKGLCVICGYGPTDDNPLQIDHWVPVACGGRTELGNLRLLHQRANLVKGANWPWTDRPEYCWN